LPANDRQGRLNGALLFMHFTQDAAEGKSSAAAFAKPGMFFRHITL
jgi:hypothetical protein